MNSEIRFDENAACDRCGQSGAYQVEGENLCAECISARGSCCLEFGSDDLWCFDDEIPAAQNRQPDLP